MTVVCCRATGLSGDIILWRNPGVVWLFEPQESVPQCCWKLKQDKSIQTSSEAAHCELVNIRQIPLLLLLLISVREIRASP